MTATQPIDPAPDWAAVATELHCPLCQYNLRGLEQPRCPECGFAFSWAEIVAGQKDKHPYLFEHQNRRNIWSFWKTYWNDCRPRKFWRELNPAQPVKIRRLMIYWFVASLTMLAAPLAQFPSSLWDELHKPVVPFRVPLVFNGRLMTFKSALPPFPPPPPFMDHVRAAWTATIDDIGRSSMISGSLVVVVWPWLTLLCLLIFSDSMRIAKIQKRHVLRVVIYGTDFGLLLLMILPLGKDARYGSGWLAVIALVCGVVTLYRVYFGYSRYLRFHLPFATVLSSQIIVFLVVLLVYLYTCGYV